VIDVEARPTSATSPLARDGLLPWLALVTGLFLADCLPPWERWCGAEFSRFPMQCFSAHVWSGSARFLGVASILLALSFLGVTLRGGLRTRPGTIGIILFAGFATAAGGKALIVLSNADKTAASQAQMNPSSPAAWVGLAVAGLALISLSVVLTQDPRVRSLVVMAVTFLVVTVLALWYAQSGFASWGGPLAPPAFLGGGNGMGITTQPGRPALFAGLIYVANDSSSDVTLDGLDFVDASPPVRVLGTYVIEGAPCLPEAVDLGGALFRHQCAYPLSGFEIAAGPGDSVPLAAVVEVESPGVYRSGWFRVRYHVGVVPFELFRTDQLTICAPEPGRRSCPGRGL
jgi:hypothetical protein